MSADASHLSEDFSDIDMEELDSYLTSPPVRLGSGHQKRFANNESAFLRFFGHRPFPNSGPFPLKGRGSNCPLL